MLSKFTGQNLIIVALIRCATRCFVFPAFKNTRVSFLFWKFVFSRAWNRRFYIRINFVVNLSLFNAKVRQVRERSVFSEVVYSRGPFGVGGWANGKIRLTISLFFFQDKA